MNLQLPLMQVFLIGMPGGSEWIFISLSLLFLLPLYFLPSIIARKGDSFVSIFFLNFLLGWTLLGWIISLVWAIYSTRNKEPIIINNNIFEAKTAPSQQDKLNHLQQLKELLDKGVLTQKEFEQQKSQILSS